MSNNTFKPDNISYTNKDFPSIYDELLELVPKLTNKWDPSLSNESDPLVVLLKLNALLADKNDYNIDKNILELFPLSVTQRGNAQKIYESLGYSLRWYESASVEVNLRWIGEPTEEGKIDLDAGGDPFIMITDDSGEIVYTVIPTSYTNLSLQTSPSSPGGAKEDLTVVALEGTVHDYEINGNTTITLQNLDSDLRLYFNEPQIAENGIFIESGQGTWTQWNRVDNLEATSLGQYSYKFGVLPNSNTCYIEFPQDIANLIGQGLKIKYIVSSGAAGTIQPDTLTSFYSDMVYDTNDDGNKEPINDKVRIWNSNASSEGKNPEDLDEAYKSYQKVVSTFNTLVTCRDYENAIFRLKEEATGKPIVSNCVVSDRTNDISSSLKIQNLTTNGNNIVLKQTNDLTNQMTPFDLKFYLLKYIYPITNRDQYNNTFKTDPLLYAQANEELEEYKSIQHNVIPISDSDKYTPYIIKNKYPINCQLTTYNKVSEKEAGTIEKNVYLALFRDYNSREVNFGEGLEYSKVVETIRNADKRIKDVILQSITYTPYYMDSNGIDYVLTSENEVYKDIVARNILAGNTQGVKFDNTFNYEFGQTAPSDIKTNVLSISTTTLIPLNNAEDYILKSNESLTLYSPNYVLRSTYANYLYYVIEEGKTISFNSKEDIVEFVGTIKFYDKRYEQAQEGGTSNQTWTYNDDDLVGTIDGTTKPAYLSFSGWPKNTTLSGDGSLGPDKTISTYDKKEVTLKPSTNGSGQYIYCYWILNNPSNKFGFTNGGEYSYMLRNGEYFLYPNSSLTELNILGSGTSITFNTPSNPDSVVTDAAKLDASDITSTSIGDIDWYKITGDITATENKLISLGYGTSVKLEGVGATYGETLISNTPGRTSITGGSYTYTPEDSSETTTITLPATPGGWKAFATINLLGSKDLPLPLYAGQRLTLKGSGDSVGTSVDGSSDTSNEATTFVQFNPGVALPGGEDVNVSYLSDYLEETLPISVYWYKEATPVKRGDNGLIQITFKPGEPDSIEYAAPLLDGPPYILPIIWSGKSDQDTLSVTGASLYIDGATPSNLPSNINAYFLKVTSNSITFRVNNTATTTGAEGVLTIGKLYRIKEDIDDAIKTKMHELQDSNNLFNYTYEVPEITNVANPASPEGLFDPNNIVNRFTIAQMEVDVTKSSIKVVNSSKL